MTAQEDYKEYLADLLIIQYRQKPKARATIKAIADLFPVDLMLSVRDSMNIETAVGVQLDMLGEYLGVDRYYTESGEVKILDDTNYRTILKLKAIANNSSLSHKDIDDALYKFFKTSVRADSTGNMAMVLTIPTGKTEVIRAALQKDALPIPMGVKLQNIIEQSETYFGYCTYDNPEDYHYSTGFLTYDEPSKEGEMLDYDKIINTGDL